MIETSIRYGDDEVFRHQPFFDYEYDDDGSVIEAFYVDDGFYDCFNEVVAIGIVGNYAALMYEDYTLHDLVIRREDALLLIPISLN